MDGELSVRLDGDGDTPGLRDRILAEEELQGSVVSAFSAVLITGRCHHTGKVTATVRRPGGSETKITAQRVSRVDDRAIRELAEGLTRWAAGQ
ncbi:hypothetical protein ACWDRB_63340 [Nonomuraea sp. NPDC003707]